MFPLVNEGYKILQEGISKGPEGIDMVYIYGYGFPRHRGGPMYWAEKEQGLERVLRALQGYSEQHPDQPWLKPAALLEQAVKNNSSIKKELKSFQQS
jgi:enoyl-CoA hydratase / 3-hydroxyacyl-CoA dehydrogenase / 3,2-trans-enoyl-CoA isomerase